MKQNLTQNLSTGTAICGVKVAPLAPLRIKIFLNFSCLGNDRADSYPMSIYGVAGTQAAKMSANSLVVFKMHNLHPIKRKTAKKEDESDSEESEDEEEDPEKEPKLKVAALKHNGCVNRIRFKTIGSTSLAAAWSEQGSVGIWSLDHCIEKVNLPG